MNNKVILKKMQNGIEIFKEPFKEISKELEISENELFERLESMKEKGIIKKFGASLNHIKIGFQANGMVVWKIASKEVEKVGGILSGYDQITHCYERVTIPDKWEYNVFAMTHCKTKKELEELVKEISENIKNYDFKIIYSTREFKKTGVQIL